MSCKCHLNELALQWPGIGLALLLILAACGQSALAAPTGAPPSTEFDTRPVLLTSAQLARLAGETVCIYNLTTW